MRLFELETFDSSDEIKSFIMTNCKNYLAENPTYKINPLLRGIKIKSVPQILKMPTNRIPQMLDLQVSNIIDQAFKMAGFKAIRSNSIFCIGDIVTAKAYSSNNAEPFVIYPIGDFDYTWSPEIYDFAFYATMMIEKGDIVLPDDFVITDKMDNGFCKRAWNLDIDFPILLGELKEIVPDISRVYGRAAFSRHAMANVKPEWMVSSLQKLFRKDGLVEAIKSEYEILISGESYLAVPYSIDSGLWV